MKNFRDLIVWQKSMALVIEIYRLVNYLPKTETYALSDQIRRCAVSIPSNIAEGYGRNAHRDYARFLSIARGSKYELETQLELCVRLGFIPEEQMKNAYGLCDEIGKMLNAMIMRLMPNH